MVRGRPTPAPAAAQIEAEGAGDGTLVRPRAGVPIFHRMSAPPRPIFELTPAPGFFKLRSPKWHQGQEFLALGAELIARYGPPAALREAVNPYCPPPL